MNSQVRCIAQPIYPVLRSTSCAAPVVTSRGAGRVIDPHSL